MRFFALVIFVGALFLAMPVRAQLACDACGLCQTSTAVPSNWESCVKCMYKITNPAKPSVPISDPKTVQTLLTPPPRNVNYTAIGCIDASPSMFSQFLIRLMANLITGIGVLGLVYGGLKVMMARGDVAAIREGKTYVIASISAILIVNFAVFIVQFAGKNILQLPFFK